MNADNAPDADAQFEQAWKLYKDERYAEAFEAYLALAEQGYSNCQTFVGWKQYCGEGTSKNTEAAISWLTEAADQDDAEAKFYLGKLYSELGQERQAIEWLEKAADQNYAPAMYKLGCAYEGNRSMPKDPGKAYELFKSSARQGHYLQEGNMP